MAATFRIIILVGIFLTPTMATKNKVKDFGNSLITSFKLYLNSTNQFTDSLNQVGVLIPGRDFSLQSLDKQRVFELIKDPTSFISTFKQMQNLTMEAYKIASEKVKHASGNFDYIFSNLNMAVKMLNEEPAQFGFHFDKVNQNIEDSDKKFKAIYKTFQSVLDLLEEITSASVNDPKQIVGPLMKRALDQLKISQENGLAKSIISPMKTEAKIISVFDAENPEKKREIEAEVVILQKMSRFTKMMLDEFNRYSNKPNPIHLRSQVDTEEKRKEWLNKVRKDTENQEKETAETMIRLDKNLNDLTQSDEM